MARLKDRVKWLRPLSGPIKGLVQRVGYDLVRSPSDRWLRDLDVRTVIDVGANTGQFASSARRQFPRAMIYSFEPIPECHSKLKGRFSHDPLFQAFPFALGAARGEGVFHRNEYAPSSSLRPMGVLHQRNFPYTAKTSTIPVEIRSLDDVARTLELNPNILVKLDVQGYEDQVIHGGLEVLKRTAIVITEVSFDELYAGQPLFGAIHETLSSLGFAYRGSLSQLPSPLDGHILQADAVYLRSSKEA